MLPRLRNLSRRRLAAGTATAERTAPTAVGLGNLILRILLGHATIILRLLPRFKNRFDRRQRVISQFYPPAIFVVTCVNLICGNHLFWLVAILNDHIFLKPAIHGGKTAYVIVHLLFKNKFITALCLAHKNDVVVGITLDSQSDF